MSENQKWHIHRPGNPITQQEWESWLNSAPGFSVTEKIWGTNPRTGRPINVLSEGAGLWKRGQGKTDVYFQLHDGKVFPIDPDEETIAKLTDIAIALGAEVTRFMP